MPKLWGNHAVVLGAGMAGLATARALSSHFGKVTVLERDRFPDEPAPRNGTPQAAHAHALLGGGLHALESLFPNFRKDLLDAGAIQTRAGTAIRLERPGFDPFPTRDLGFDIFFMSRPLLEDVTRRRVGNSSNISIETRRRVTEIVASPDTLRVEGVRYDSEDGKSHSIDADFVVDATGRGILTLQLLEKMGSKSRRRRRSELIRPIQPLSSNGLVIGRLLGMALCSFPARREVAVADLFSQSRGSNGLSPSAAITATHLLETGKASLISSRVFARPLFMTPSRTPNRRRISLAFVFRQACGAISSV